MTVLEKLNKILQEQETDDRLPDNEDDYENDDLVIEKMMDLIEILDPEQLTEDQADLLYEIFDLLDAEEATNEVFKRRVRRDLAARRKRRREYRQRRSQIKIRARRYRRSAKGKKTLRKAKRYNKYGRTATGKRQRVFIGPK